MDVQIHKTGNSSSLRTDDAGMPVLNLRAGDFNTNRNTGEWLVSPVPSAFERPVWA